MSLSKYHLEVLSVSHSISAWPKLGSSLVLWIPLELNLGQSKSMETDKNYLSIWTWYISGNWNEGEPQSNRPSNLYCRYNRENFFKKKKKLDFDVFVLDVPIQLFKMITRRCPVSETGLIRVVLILLLDFPTFF